MRKIVLLFAVLTLITACSKPKNEKTLFKYAFKKGQELKYKLTTINEASELIKADSTTNTEVSETANYTIALSVLEIDADTVAEFNVNITAIDLYSKLNGKETRYNSAEQMKPEDKQPFIQYDAILNSPFRMRLNGKGEIIEVTRLDKIIDKLLALQPPPKPLTAEEKAMVTKNITERAIQPLVQQLFRLLPGKVVAVDSTWTYSYPNVVGKMQINNKVTFKYKEMQTEGGQNIAKVEATLSNTIQGEKSMSDGAVTAVFEEPRISGGGTVFFDTENGILKNSETFTTQEFKVVLTSSNPAEAKKKTDRKQTSKNTLRVELLK